MRFAKTRSLNIPEDVGLIGYDDDQFADMITPAIASVSQNPQEIGRVAAEQLLSSVNGQATPPKNTRIPSEIQMRDSL